MAKIEMPKAYESTRYEDAIYAAWEQSGFFNPDKLPGERKESFSIVLPPPNVTGTLHMGHAVMLAVEDIMVRFNRMRGKKTLWLPGTDHAAIATQTKVEKLLMKDGMKNPRAQLGREEFLNRVKAFAASSHDTIVNQAKKMGASLDWSREAYTLDEKRNRAVNTVFKMMYDDGLIYRGNRLVNWCTHCLSTLADDEVEHKEMQAKLYTFKYDKSFPIAISTTRPETKLGDTGVAVHPDDQRYVALVGKIFEVDFAGKKLVIKIVADAGVDPAFGTGALGVTPSHSHIDAQIASRNNLPFETVIGEDGCMTVKAGEGFVGKTVLDARKLVVEHLREKGLLEREEDTAQNLAVCYRCGSAVEPLPKLQWFIDVNKSFAFRASKFHPIDGIKNGQKITLKELMSRVVRSGQIRIIPGRFDKTYFHWIDNLRDWNISRQIWFGHRVPVWYDMADLTNAEGICLLKPGEEIHLDSEIIEFNSGWECADMIEKTVSGFTFGLAKMLVERKIISWSDLRSKIDEVLVDSCRNPRVGSESVSESEVQDPDTLDTWFSSGIWTFSTLGWPDDTKDLRDFHPTSVLETGYDILFFWIARMILMTTYTLGEVPFREVYLHGLVRDEEGRKMSKSLDNVIDPLDMIKLYGADATRLSLVIGSTPGNDSKLSETKVAGYRNFTNKLWNISRFIFSCVDDVACVSESELGNQTLADRWILSRFQTLQKEVTGHLDAYEFSQAGEKLRDFTWGEFADWYLEIAKIQILNSKIQTSQILLHILEQLLVLWHPFMPFVTEEIWKVFQVPPLPDLSAVALAKAEGGLGGVGGYPLLMIHPWSNPKLDHHDPAAESDFNHARDVIVAIRNIRSFYKVAPKQLVDVVVIGAVSEGQEQIIKTLARAGDLRFDDRKPSGDDYAEAVVGKTRVFVSLVGLVDKELERKKIDVEKKEIVAYLDSLASKLSNNEFLAKAPAHVIETMKRKQSEAQSKLRALDS